MCGSFPGLLIGRTAVHSGKDPAFVAYDQFLSTGILQPLSRGEVRCGSKAAVAAPSPDISFSSDSGGIADIPRPQLGATSRLPLRNQGNHLTSQGLSLPRSNRHRRAPAFSVPSAT